MTSAFRSFQTGSPDYGLALLLRYSVLRIPLNRTFSRLDLLQDQEDEHFGLFQGDELLACLTISVSNQQTVKMRQVAVAQNQQRSGFGRMLVLQVEEVLKTRNVKQVYCHARETAVPFYLQLGYTIVGELFTEVGLPHRKMVHML